MDPFPKQLTARDLAHIVVENLIVYWAKIVHVTVWYMSLNLLSLRKKFKTNVFTKMPKL